MGMLAGGKWQTDDEADRTAPKFQRSVGWVSPA